MNTDLIKKLRAASPDWVSSEELREPSGVSRAAISKQVKVLTGLGYPIESGPGKGYRLMKDMDTLAEPVVKAYLKGTRFEKATYSYRDVVGSTNDEIRSLAVQGAPEGSLVVAEFQEKGRGRRGRNWFGRAEDSLQFSVLLRPPLPPREATLIPLLAATSVYRALKSLGIGGVGIKWPNDVLVEGRKLCGVLCEMSVDMEGIQYAMLGIGLNVNTLSDDFPDEIKMVAASMASVSGKKWRRSEVLVRILQELECQIKQAWVGQKKYILDAWKEGAVTLGKEVSVKFPDGSELQGVALDLSDQGALILRDHSGTVRTLHSGEISLRSTDG